MKDRREYYTNYHRDRRRSRRKLVVAGLGGKCWCCGEKEVKFLNIDHILGGGTKDRSTINNNQLIDRIIREGLPKSKYRVLCYNCNIAISILGYCPHHPRKTRIVIKEYKSWSLLRFNKRLQVIKQLGGECVCCKETESVFLAIDHTHGGGNKERKTMNPSTRLSRVISEGVPVDKYRILCHNCNGAIGVHGFCPHDSVVVWHKK
jgi:hypothetical protein